MDSPHQRAERKDGRRPSPQGSVDAEPAELPPAWIGHRTTCVLNSQDAVDEVTVSGSWRRDCQNRHETGLPQISQADPPQSGNPSEPPYAVPHVR